MNDENAIAEIIHDGPLFWATCLIENCEFVRPYMSNELAVEAVDQHQEDVHDME